MHLSVILFTGGWEYLGRYPLGRYTPPGRYPPTPTVKPPPTMHAGIWSTSGRYASYWNAFLLKLSFCIAVTDIANKEV